MMMSFLIPPLPRATVPVQPTTCSMGNVASTSHWFSQIAGLRPASRLSWMSILMATVHLDPYSRSAAVLEQWPFDRARGEACLADTECRLALALHRRSRSTLVQLVARRSSTLIG